MFGDKQLVVVEDTRDLESLSEKLVDVPVLGVDTEADSFHHYRERVCLIQISDLEMDYIIDPLKIEDCSSLRRLFSNPDQVVIMHGSDYDVVSLRRDYGIQFHRIFDTMIAALFLALPRIGLADLIHRYFGHTIDKQYQRHDWSSRPLLEEHLEYARGDTHFLLALREVLNRKLRQNNRLAAFEEECSLLAQRVWTGRSQDPAAFFRVKRSRSLDEDGLRVLRALWDYRDKRAQKLDRPAFKVLSDSIMLSIASEKPQSRDSLHQLIRKNSALARKHGEDLLDTVKSGLSDERPLPKRPKSKGRHTTSAPGIDRLLVPLKKWRNNIVETRGLSPVVVVNNTLLKEIARAHPTSLEELSTVPGIRQWQVRDLGDDILGVIQGVVPPNRPGRKRRRKKTTLES